MQQGQAMGFGNTRKLVVVIVVFAGSCRRAPHTSSLSKGRYPVITPTLVSSESKLEPPTDVVRIEFGELFGELFGAVNVVLYANDKAVFSGVLTTGPHGLAHTLTLPWPAPRIALVIVIDGKGWRCDADLSRGRCLQINYRQGQMKVLQTVHGLIYM